MAFTSAVLPPVSVPRLKTQEARAFHTISISSRVESAIFFGLRRYALPKNTERVAATKGKKEKQAWLASVANHQPRLTIAQLLRAHHNGGDDPRAG